MKKLESSLINMVIVLVAVAIVSSALLASVNKATEGPIKEQDELALANGIKSVMGVENLTVASEETLIKNIDGKDYTFVIYKTDDQNGDFLGAAVKSTTMGFGGALEVLVGFDATGKVLGYTILQHAETPGLGAKADKWFQKDGKGSIIGRTLTSDKPLVVSKDGGDVDAITASTITSRAFLKAVNQAYAVYAGQDVDGNSGATKQNKTACEQGPACGKDCNTPCGKSCETPCGKAAGCEKACDRPCGKAAGCMKDCKKPCGKAANCRKECNDVKCPGPAACAESKTTD